MMLCGDVLSCVLGFLFVFSVPALYEKNQVGWLGMKI